MADQDLDQSTAQETSGGGGAAPAPEPSPTSAPAPEQPQSLPQPSMGAVSPIVAKLFGLSSGPLSPGPYADTLAASFQQLAKMRQPQATPQIEGPPMPQQPPAEAPQGDLRVKSALHDELGKVTPTLIQSLRASLNPPTTAQAIANALLTFSNPEIGTKHYEGELARQQQTREMLTQLERYNMMLEREAERQQGMVERAEAVQQARDDLQFGAQLRKHNISYTPEDLKSPERRAELMAEADQREGLAAAKKELMTGLRSLQKGENPMQLRIAADDLAQKDPEFAARVEPYLQQLQKDYEQGQRVQQQFATARLTLAQASAARQARLAEHAKSLSSITDAKALIPLLTSAQKNVVDAENRAAGIEKQLNTLQQKMSSFKAAGLPTTDLERQAEALGLQIESAQSDVAEAQGKYQNIFDRYTLATNSIDQHLNGPQGVPLQAKMQEIFTQQLDGIKDQLRQQILSNQALTGATVPQTAGAMFDEAVKAHTDGAVDQQLQLEVRKRADVITRNVMNQLVALGYGTRDQVAEGLRRYWSQLRDTQSALTQAEQTSWTPPSIQQPQQPGQQPQGQVQAPKNH